MSNADAIVHSMVSCAKVSGAMCGPPACQMRACELEFPDWPRLAQGGSHGSHLNVTSATACTTRRELRLTLTARGGVLTRTGPSSTKGVEWHK